MGEPEAGVEAYRSGDQEEGEGHYAHVAEVEYDGNEAVHVKLGKVVPHSVKHHVDRTGAWGQEWPPPPTVVLVAELEVAKEDRDLTAGYNQHHHD